MELCFWYCKKIIVISVGKEVIATKPNCKNDKTWWKARVCAKVLSSECHTLIHMKLGILGMGGWFQMGSRGVGNEKRDMEISGVFKHFLSNWSLS